MPPKPAAFFSLSLKEEAAMKVLWDTEDALSASEIAERIPNRTWPATSIQNILRGLEQKGAVRVDAIVKLGKAYGRLFRPTLSANEYAALQFQRYYHGKKGSSFSLISSLLGNASDIEDEEIDALRALLDSYKKKESH